MIEMYFMIFLCIIVSMVIGFIAVTMYMVWVVIQHDLEEKRKENDDAGKG
jgi:hypothetical protein